MMALARMNHYFVRFRNVSSSSSASKTRSSISTSWLERATTWSCTLLSFVTSSAFSVSDKLNWALNLATVSLYSLFSSRSLSISSSTYTIRRKTIVQNRCWLRRFHPIVFIPRWLRWRGFIIGRKFVNRLPNWLNPHFGITVIVTNEFPRLAFLIDFNDDAKFTLKCKRDENRVQKSASTALTDINRRLMEEMSCRVGFLDLKTFFTLSGFKDGATSRVVTKRRSFSK